MLPYSRCRQEVPIPYANEPDVDLRALRRTSYAGALTMEYTPCEEGRSRKAAICEAEQDIYARKGLEYLRNLHIFNLFSLSRYLILCFDHFFLPL